MSEFVTKQIDAQMKTCTGCESEIAAEAEYCPHYGALQRARFRNRPRGWWLSGWGVLKSVLVLAGIALLAIVLHQMLQPAIVNTLPVECCAL